jgi:hypothetical protein
MTKTQRLLAAVALLVLGAGCNSFHYFDITVVFGSIGIEEAGGIKACFMSVSGADTDNVEVPMTTSGGAPVCPIANNWPTLGMFEYSTFTDSGNLTFTLDAYNTTNLDPTKICITGSTTVAASSAITHTGMITLAQGSQSCITQ